MQWHLLGASARETHNVASNYPEMLQLPGGAAFTLKKFDATGEQRFGVELFPPLRDRASLLSSPRPWSETACGVS
jgi:hypothetical protein